MKHFFSLLLACLASLAYSLSLAIPNNLASESDILPFLNQSTPQTQNQPFQKLHLLPLNQKRAEAIQQTLLGFLKEQQEGTDAALENFDKALTSDPSLAGIALLLANEYIHRGEFQKAISRLKDTIRANPSAAFPEINLAEIYLFHLNKPHIAERHAQRALLLAPHNFTPRALLWEIAFRQKKTKKADSILEDAANSQTPNPNYWIQFAELHLRLPTSQLQKPKIYQRIQNALSNAIKYANQNPELLAKIGDLYFLFEKYDKAVENYQIAYAKKPDLPQIRLRLANALIMTPQAQEAAPILRQLFQESPQDIVLCDRIIWLATERQDWNEALLYHQKALAISPPNPERYMAIAKIAFSLQKFELARFYLENAIARFPNFPMFYYHYALALSYTKDYFKSLNYFSLLEVELNQGNLQINPGEFYYEYGNTAYKAGLLDRSIELLRKAVATNGPFAAPAANDLGYIWVKRGENLDEAGQLIRKALEADPNNGAYLDSLGWWYFQRKEFSKALSTLLQALEALDSPDPEVLEHIGDTLAALGNFPQAFLFWNKSRQINPNNPNLLGKIHNTEKNFLLNPQQTNSPSTF
ncbi:MAG: tetratricopeptide repeat protein [Chthoniobacterales bacterium]|nr:tetratricopeptide repeat protein [Chthoniobacterales bacterium]